VSSTGIQSIKTSTPTEIGILGDYALVRLNIGMGIGAGISSCAGSEARSLEHT
jgi:hypothetical protein